MALYLLGNGEQDHVKYLVRDYLIDQDETVKKLITLVLNLVMNIELKQQTGAPFMNAQKTGQLIEMGNAEGL